MLDVLIIALAGSCGALMRYALIQLLASVVCIIPIATLLVNVTGCLMAGLLISFPCCGLITIQVRTWLLVGLLGAYTTMSSFILETEQLFASGGALYAVSNIFLTFGGCLLAFFVGKSVGMAFFARF